MNLKETYNKIAEEWHKDHQTDTWWFIGTDKFISYLNKGDLILDVGCGGGIKSKYLIDRGFKVIGIDISERMIEIAKREVINGVFYTMDLKNIDQLPDSFDGIFIQAVLLHIPKNQVGADIVRLSQKLKQKGYFYLVVKEQRSEGVEEEIKTENDYGYAYHRFFSYFTEEELVQYLLNSKLTPVYKNIHLVGRTNWIHIIARKE